MPEVEPDLQAFTARRDPVEQTVAVDVQERRPGPAAQRRLGLSMLDWLRFAEGPPAQP